MIIINRTHEKNSFKRSQNENSKHKFDLIRKQKKISGNNNSNE